MHRGAGERTSALLHAAALERLIQTLVEGPMAAGARRPWLDVEHRVFVYRFTGTDGLRVEIRSNNQFPPPLPLPGG